MKQTTSVRRAKAHASHAPAANDVQQQPGHGRQGRTPKRDRSDFARLTNGNDKNGEIRKALRESNERFLSFFQAANVGLVSAGPRAEIRLCNQAALDLLGLSEDQLIGKTCFDPDWHTISEDGRPCLGRDLPIPRAIATRQPVCDVVIGIFRPRY
jgi:PAS domain-containing protein